MSLLSLESEVWPSLVVQVFQSICATAGGDQGQSPIMRRAAEAAEHSPEPHRIHAHMVLII